MREKDRETIYMMLINSILIPKTLCDKSFTLHNKFICTTKLFNFLVFRSVVEHAVSRFQLVAENSGQHTKDLFGNSHDKWKPISLLLPYLRLLASGQLETVLIVIISLATGHLKTNFLTDFSAVFALGTIDFSNLMWHHLDMVD